MKIGKLAFGDRLPESEWDFKKLDAEYLAATRAWEFSRTATLEKSPAFENSEDSDHPTNPPPYHWHPKPWPHRAFSLLSKEEVESEAWMWIPKEGASGDDFEDCVRISRYPSSSGLQPLDLTIAASYLEKDIPTKTNLMSIASGEETRWLATFGIDWRHSNKNLIEGFKEWLLLRRPAEDAAPQIESRGGSAGSSPKSLLADLQALGIYRRLMHHPNATIGKIISAYEDENANENDWSKAKKRALRMLKNFR